MSNDQVHTLSTKIINNFANRLYQRNDQVNILSTKIYQQFYQPTLSIAAWRLSGGMRSVLLRTTTMDWQVIWPITRHSAVCVCIPLTMSTTSSIRSMICAPAINQPSQLVGLVMDFNRCILSTTQGHLKFVCSQILAGVCCHCQPHRITSSLFVHGC